ncbi:MAG: hypothetical protein SF051_16430 [Elusimicrobiota bacterium]|nr:hypothetical protein [Elusimicrobiota bacterium]
MRKSMMTAAVLAAALLAAPAFLHSQTGGLRFFGPLSRVVTPNGDGRNDLAFFCFDNPADSDITGKVFTLFGAEVASMTPRASSAGTSCPGGFLPQRVTWDGRSSSGAAGSGLYVYRISIEGRQFTGTLLVVR